MPSEPPDRRPGPIEPVRPPSGEGDDVFAGYDEPRPRPADRPWLLANMVTGLDGSLAWHGRVGPLSSDADRSLFVRLRGLADGVLVGAGTVRAEGYGPVRLPEDQRHRRRAAGRAETPPLVVVSRSLGLDWEAPLWSGTVGPRPLVLTTSSAPEEELARAADRAEVIVVGDGSVDLRQGMQRLAGLGMEVVVTEGGPTLLDELVAADLLDELCLTIAPHFGGDPLTMAHRAAPADRLTSFSLEGVVHGGDELYLRYLRCHDDDRQAMS